jgi:hypothetical protein
VDYVNNDLWREIVWRTAQCPGVCGTVFRKSEVGDLDMPVIIEENIFGLEIPVYYIERMQVVQSQCNFCSVEFGNRVGKSLLKSVRAQEIEVIVYKTKRTRTWQRVKRGGAWLSNM